MTSDMPENVPARSTVRQTRLDSYVDRYAARTKGMSASEIRALFAVASRPEVVSLAGGMPNIAGLPLDVVGNAIGDLVRDNGAVAMQYGSGQGDPKLREQICDVMSLEGIEAHPDDVVITVGSQQAVDLVTRVFCDPGDVVICEAPSYVGALGVFRAYQCEVVHVAMDDDGVQPEALEQAIAAVAAAGKKAKFFYTIPNFHNPAGVSLSLERRSRVLEICQRAGLLVLEDNPYGLLGFEGDPVRAMRADDSEGIIYLGSFSKTFAPGFRVGWALAPHAVREKLVLAQESATLCPPVFSQLAISSYLSRGRAMLPRAVTNRVAYVPGTAFFADGFGAQCMRLSYCHPTPERITEGVRRLGAVIKEELELRQTFGAVAPGHGREYDAPGPELT